MMISISKILEIICGKDVWIRKDLNMPLRYMGNSYGGFWTVEEKWGEDNRPIIYSFGIGEDLSFSLDVLKKYMAEVFAFDPTPKAINYVNRIKEREALERFCFYPYAIGVSDGETRFYLPQNDEYVSGSVVHREELNEQGIDVDIYKLSSIMKMLGHTYIDILKLDIEGSEFDVISNILEEKIQIGQICVEVHQRFFEDSKDKMKILLNELHRSGYKCVSVAENQQLLTFYRLNQ